MANGPGKYDPEVTAARESAEADGAILIILNGNRGSGFSVQLPASPENKKAIVKTTAQLLRAIATSIENDANAAFS